jgi:hypothetical protein
MKKVRLYGLVSVLVFIVFLNVPQTASAISEDDVRAMMATVNDHLAAMGEDFRLGVVEYYTENINNTEVGQIVYFDDRTHQLSSHWVPFDPNRDSRRNITWLTDQVDGTASGVTLEQTQTALSAAMATWNGVDCATIPLDQLDDFGWDWGYVQYQYWRGPDDPPGINGGSPIWWYGDIRHCGWLPPDFYEVVLGPGTSTYVLGVSFTFIWIDTSTGLPSDMDNNGKDDVAFKEFYYNNWFPWGINTTGYPIDVESIVLHEVGHGLSLDHFGKLFRTPSNGKLHFAPEAVMNAGYTGRIHQELFGTDIASFCSIWAHWPNN